MAMVMEPEISLISSIFLYDASISLSLKIPASMAYTVPPR